jgi:general secretion pathway protein G
MKTFNGKKARGFTLIELLVVLAILGMLAALVGPAIFNNLTKGQKATAASQISNLQSALDSYRLDVGHYPETLAGLTKNDTGRDAWAGPYLRGELPKDPWGHDYYYKPGDKEFVLMSYGKDGVPGGQGDDADIGR